jgi:hypothetical protein
MVGAGGGMAGANCRAGDINGCFGGKTNRGGAGARRAVRHRCGMRQRSGCANRGDLGQSTPVLRGTKISDVVSPVASVETAPGRLRSIAGRYDRIGLGMLVAAIMTAGTGGEALAKSGKRHVHARHIARHGCGGDSITPHQSVLLQRVRLGPMRYYGGPKSPMWRAPAEN